MDTIARAKIEHSLFPASSARPPTIPGSRDRQRFTHLARIVPFSLIRGPACDGEAGRCFLRRTSTRNAKLDEVEENIWKNESQKEHPPFPRLSSRTPDVAIHVNVRRSLVNLPNGRWLYAAYDSDIYRYYIEMKEKKRQIDSAMAGGCWSSRIRMTKLRLFVVPATMLLCLIKRKLF